MALKRLDNIGIVVDDLELTIDFFQELGLHLEGRATIEGEWAGRVTGLADQRVEIAMMRTPDGHSRLELSRFLTPPVVVGEVVQYQDSYRLCYIRGPEGLLIGLAQELN
jgi:hypothetical protein